MRTITHFSASALRMLSTTAITAFTGVNSLYNVINQTSFFGSNTNNFSCTAAFTNFKPSVIQSFENALVKLNYLIITTGAQVFNGTASVICAYDAIQDKTIDGHGDANIILADTSTLLLTIPNDTLPQYHTDYEKVVKLSLDACDKNKHLLHADIPGEFLTMGGLCAGSAFGFILFYCLYRSAPNAKLPIFAKLSTLLLYLGGVGTLLTVNAMEDLFNHWVYTTLASAAIPVVSFLPMVISLLIQKYGSHSTELIQEKAESTSPRLSVLQSLTACAKNCFSPRQATIDANSVNETSQLLTT